METKTQQISTNANPWQIPPTEKREVKLVIRSATIESVLAAIDDLKTRAANAVTDFEAEKASSAKHDRLIQIGNRLAEIEPEYKRLLAEIEEIKNSPTPQEQFLRNVEQLEHETRMRASDALGLLLDAKAKQVFEIPYAELSNEVQADLGKPLKTLRQLASNAQASFALTRDKTVAMARAALIRIAGNLSTIAEFTANKAKQYSI
jgi:predicted RNase H-like nuclease (RuvC/YqgF family)